MICCTKELIELNKALNTCKNESERERASDFIQFAIDRIKRGKDMNRFELQSCFKLDILDLLCVANGVERSDVLSKKRTPQLVDTRQMFVYFNRNIRSEMIADYLNIHRTTVIYHKEKAADNMQYDKGFRERYKTALEHYEV